MIWCVEDDSGIRDIEIYTLKSMGFEAQGFSDGETFFEALEKEKPELVILDIMLPGEDGVEILKRLRTEPDTYRIPVIMATAKGTEFDKIQSLDLGADDYLVKPFGMMEMISRVKAVLRRCEPEPVQRLLKADGVIVNLDEHTVSVDGERILLTFKEYELLKLFLSNPGLVFTRDQLMSDVWGVDYIGESRTVDMHIRTLRQKLGSYSYMIETVRNVGYRMEAKK
ncbi:MAG: response regulator transcription factor [Parasporobacterium sp.]|nr:response regulator transcription factor [Parasporobacterium sp.]